MISSPFSPSFLEDLSVENGGTRSRLMSLSRILGGNDSPLPFSPPPLHSPVSFFDDEVSEDPLPFNLEDLAFSLEARASLPSCQSNNLIDGKRAHHVAFSHLFRASPATPCQILFGARFSPRSSGRQRATPVQSPPASTPGASIGLPPILLVGGIESPLVSPGFSVEDSITLTPSMFDRASRAAPTRSRSPFPSKGLRATPELLPDSHPPFPFSTSYDSLTPLPPSLHRSDTEWFLDFKLDGFTCQDLMLAFSFEAKSPARDGFKGRHMSFLDKIESPVISHASFIADSLTLPCEHNPGDVHFCRLASPSIAGHP